jgi:hypothetical protein
MLATNPTNNRRRMPKSRASGLVGFAILVVVSLGFGVNADERQQGGNDRDDGLATRRFDLMQKRVAAAKARSVEADFPEGFAARPIFKYSDPARGYVAAAVWKLGEEGRPKALLATELDRCDHGKPCIAYEYLSLTTTPFSLKADDMDWAPSSTLFEFKPIPRAPAPAETPQLRLRQLREAARRFAAHEEVKDERCILRLLPNPVDRYTPAKDERADGAIFFFTFGTNPEVVLLIESDGKRWKYAAGRLTGAPVVVLTLDDTKAWEGAPCQAGRDSPFTGSITPIAIPGIAEDGSEIKESDNPR